MTCIFTSSVILEDCLLVNVMAYFIYMLGTVTKGLDNNFL